jgi:micrococcal nuclease
LTKLSFLILVCSVLCISCIAQNTIVFVKKVIDGDTFIDSKNTHIRLIGIDAPELHYSRHKVPQKKGKEAFLFLQKLIENKNVELEFDIKQKDIYNRVLAYVYVKNKKKLVFVNENLVEQGLAKQVYYKPNKKYIEKLKLAQKKAQEKHLGIWDTN